MGTRCLTILEDKFSGENPTEIAVLYGQWDGYPEAHGKDLKEFLEEMEITPGVRRDRPGPSANGGGCLAAQIVAHFKKGPGSFYLMPAGTRDTGEQYIYTITPEDEGGIRLKVQARSMATWLVIYDGPITNFDPEKVGGALENKT